MSYSNDFKTLYIDIYKTYKKRMCQVSDLPLEPGGHGRAKNINNQTGEKRPKNE